MARSPRTDAPGLHHHVTLRGVGACDVFRDDADRRRFVRVAGRHVREGGGRCLAWALMTNHIHLVLETGHTRLSEVVHAFAFRYAQAFNWRYGRPGHLFQNRFGSEVIDGDDYLRTAIAYVHLNPVRAGMVPSVASLADFRWTGHAALCGGRPDGLLDVPSTLTLFGDDVTGARTSAVALLASCLARADEDPHWHWQMFDGRPVAAGERLDADGELVRRSEELDRARREADARRLRIARLRRAGWTVDRLIAAACTMFRVEAAELYSFGRTRKVCEARAVVAALAVSELGATAAEVARRLDLSETAVRRGLVAGRKIAQERGVSLGERGLARV